MVVYTPAPRALPKYSAGHAPTITGHPMIYWGLQYASNHPTLPHPTLLSPAPKNHQPTNHLASEVPCMRVLKPGQRYRAMVNMPLGLAPRFNGPPCDWSARKLKCEHVSIST